MSDEIRDRITDDEPDAPMTPGRRAAAVAVVTVIVVIAGYLVLRVASPAIRPDQALPPGHYSAQCGLCHPVTESAKTIEIAR